MKIAFSNKYVQNFVAITQIGIGLVIFWIMYNFLHS